MCIRDRDYAQITRSANINVVIGETERDVRDRLAWMRDHDIKAGVPESRVDQQVEAEKAGVAVGAPEHIAEKLNPLKALGLAYTIAYFAEAAYDPSGMHLFENTVLPEVR